VPHQNHCLRACLETLKQDYKSTVFLADKETIKLHLKILSLKNISPVY